MITLHSDYSFLISKNPLVGAYYRFYECVLLRPYSPLRTLWGMFYLATGVDNCNVRYNGLLVELVSQCIFAYCTFVLN